MTDSLSPVILNNVSRQANGHREPMIGEIYFTTNPDEDRDILCSTAYSNVSNNKYLLKEYRRQDYPVVSSKLPSILPSNVVGGYMEYGGEINLPLQLNSFGQIGGSDYPIYNISPTGKVIILVSGASKTVATSDDFGKTWSLGTANMPLSSIHRETVKGPVWHDNKWWICYLATNSIVVSSSNDGITWTTVETKTNADTGRTNSLNYDHFISSSGTHLVYGINGGSESLNNFGQVYITQPNYTTMAWYVGGNKSAPIPNFTSVLNNPRPPHLIGMQYVYDRKGPAYFSGDSIYIPYILGMTDGNYHTYNEDNIYYGFIVSHDKGQSWDFKFITNKRSHNSISNTIPEYYVDMVSSIVEDDGTFYCVFRGNSRNIGNNYSLSVLASIDHNDDVSFNGIGRLPTTISHTSTDPVILNFMKIGGRLQIVEGGRSGFSPMNISLDGLSGDLSNSKFVLFDETLMPNLASDGYLGGFTTSGNMNLYTNWKITNMVPFHNRKVFDGKVYQMVGQYANQQSPQQITIASHNYVNMSEIMLPPNNSQTQVNPLTYSFADSLSGNIYAQWVIRGR